MSQFFVPALKDALKGMAVPLESPAMKTRTGLAITLVLALVSCGGREADAPPQRADWVIHSNVVFLEADGKTRRTVPHQALRLWLPYVVGDLYGAPNAGEIVPSTLAPDMSFTVNLNAAAAKLPAALIPTEFSQHWMQIEPSGARIARLSPWVLPADGITPLGRSEWLDAGTGAKLLLIYLDRPARVRGDIVYEGRTLRFDIEAKEPGYVWVKQPEGSGTYTATPRPTKVVLAVLPS